MTETGEGTQAVREFFRDMGRCCAERDFDSAEALFAADVVSFGTKATVVHGLAALRTQQWEHIWPNIDGFEMLLDELQTSAHGDLAWGMLPWTSTGYTDHGDAFVRPGRATAVLERRNGVWLCIHTHFSLAPAG